MNGLEPLRLTIDKLRPFLKKGSIDKEGVEFLKPRLDQISTFISSPIFKIGFPQLQRVTINKNLPNKKNERINDINKLKYPPSDDVKKYGRANNVGQSIFYGTIDSYLIALNEMKPKVGDLITVSTWRLRDDESLSVSPIFKITSEDNITHNELSLRFSIVYQKLLKHHAKEVAEQIEELLQFIAECFAKDVEYGNNYDYFMSSYFANKFFSELDNGNVEALVYPSVKVKLKFSNIAIKPEVFDKKYQLLEVEENIIREIPKKKDSGYLSKVTGWTRKFKNREILWS